MCPTAPHSSYQVTLIGQINGSAESLHLRYLSGSQMVAGEHKS